MEGFLLHSHFCYLFPHLFYEPSYFIFLCETTPNNCDAPRFSHLNNYCYKLQQILTSIIFSIQLFIWLPQQNFFSTETTSCIYFQDCLTQCLAETRQSKQCLLIKQLVRNNWDFCHFLWGRTNVNHWNSKQNSWSQWNL